MSVNLEGFMKPFREKHDVWKAFWGKLENVSGWSSKNMMKWLAFVIFQKVALLLCTVSLLALIKWIRRKWKMLC